MIKSINYWTVGGFEGEKPVKKAMAEAKKMGFEAIELCFGAGELSENVKESACRQMRKDAKEIGIRISSLATGYYWGTSLSASRKKERDKAIAFTKKYIQAASWLGVNAVLVIPGAVDVGWDPSVRVTSYQDVWKNATASVRKCIPTAKRCRVSIAIENVWNKFLTGPYEMRMFIDQFKTPFVGSYFDVGNVVITGYPEHWIEILGKKRIKRVHVKNFSRDDAGGVLHGFGDNLLKGDINWKNVTAALKKIGYAGFVTAEMLPFSRLPNLVLPDMKMARQTAKAMGKIFG